MKEIKFKIETHSNLLIGGNEMGFVIGGIDEKTVTDHEGFPYIPGSSFKGAFRKIVREHESEEIINLYSNYVDLLKKRAKEKEVDVETWENKVNDKIKSKMELLFGIEGFNQSPRLVFSDLYLTDEKDIEKCFSLDAKNSIIEDEESGKLKSNPRFYKSARKGLIFFGSIRFYRPFGSLSNKDLFMDEKCELIREYIATHLLVFNDGFYRLGNSKSRGYGEIKVIEIDGKEVGDSK